MKGISVGLKLPINISLLFEPFRSKRKFTEVAKKKKKYAGKPDKVIFIVQIFSFHKKGRKREKKHEIYRKPRNLNIYHIQCVFL